MIRRFLSASICLGLLLAAGCSARLDRTPEILLFTVSPTTLDGSGTVTLAWTTRNVTALELLGPGGVQVDTSAAAPGKGRVQVTLEQPGTFSFLLTGLGDDGQRSPQVAASLDVRNVPQAQIVRFTATPSTLATGQTVVLDYLARNATRITLLDDEGNVLLDSSSAFSGAFETRPSANTTYSLIARGLGIQRVTATSAVQVEPAPRIDRFEALPAGPQLTGTRVLLTWATSDTDRVVLRDPQGAVLLDSSTELQGSLARLPTANETYTLEAHNAYATTTATLDLVVYGPPTIVDFVATPPGPVITGTAVTLSWSTAEIDTVRVIDGSGNELLPSTPASTTTLQITPTATTLYRLEATGPGGMVSRTLEVVVLPTPAIDAFDVTPASPIDPGSAVNLVWQTTDATRVRLIDDSTVAGTVLVDTTTDLDGARVLTVDRDLALTFEASGPGGVVTTTRSVETRVIIDSFVATPPAAQPGTWTILAWRSRGGARFELRDGANIICANTVPALADQGSCATQLPQTLGPVAFDLVVTSNGGRTDTASLTVDVVDGPNITAFTASAGAVTIGESFDLAWTVLDDPAGGVPTLALTDNLGTIFDLSALDPNNGTITLSGASEGTRTFTLTAQTPGTTVSTATTAVQIAPPPRIDTFAATPQLLDTAAGLDTAQLSFVNRGGASAWLWALDAAGVPISPALWQSTVAAQIAAGSVTVSPTITTRYRLEVWNAAGRSTTAELTLPVDTLGFTAAELSPSQRVPGESATLTYTASSLATKVTLSPPQPLIAGPATGPYQDISATGTAVTNLTTSDFTGNVWDEGVATLTLPFAFPFFGSTQTQVIVTTNGYLSFDLSLTDPAALHPATMPDPALPGGGLIAPFWDDLDGAGGAGAIHFEAGSDTGGAFFVIQWSSFQLFGVATSNLNFQVILRDDGGIETRYGTMSSATAQPRADGAAALIGVESVDGTVGNLVSLDVAATGGLSNTGFSLSPLPLAGTITLTPGATTDYVLCAADAAASSCQTLHLVVVQPGDLMITELMLDPAAASAPDAIFFELLNTSAETLDLAGWTLGDGSGTHLLAPLSGSLLAPGATAVIAASSDPATNGGLTPTAAFGTDLAFTPAAGTLTLDLRTLRVDAVSWDSSWAIPTGASLQAAPFSAGSPVDPAANDLPTAWCISITPFGAGDLGSPGQPNALCP